MCDNAQQMHRNRPVLNKRCAELEGRAIRQLLAGFDVSGQRGMPRGFISESAQASRNPVDAVTDSEQSRSSKQTLCSFDLRRREDQQAHRKCSEQDAPRDIAR
jgi:hypothetical protein